jgi:glycosyltransferase involved in cell wall biosynthesis
MQLSLVLATVDRIDEVARLLASLSDQVYRDFEIIVVDQNGDDRLVPVLETHRQRCRIVHLRCARGASRARNVGLSRASGEIVAFPDDDCWYPPDLLGQVVARLASTNNVDGLSGCCEDGRGNRTITRWSRRPQRVTKLSVWRTTTAITVFLRRSVMCSAVRFDETLGPGANTPWGAGEDIEFVIRAIESGARIEYDPQLVVFHPNPLIDYGEAARNRAHRYAAGMGRVLRQHRYPFWFVAYQWLRPMLGSAISLVSLDVAKARFRWAAARGRVSGWLAS